MYMAGMTGLNDNEDVMDLSFSFSEHCRFSNNTIYISIPHASIWGMSFLIHVLWEGVFTTRVKDFG